MWPRVIHPAIPSSNTSFFSLSPTLWRHWILRKWKNVEHTVIITMSSYWTPSNFLRNTDARPSNKQEPRNSWTGLNIYELLNFIFYEGCIQYMIKSKWGKFPPYLPRSTWNGAKLVYLKNFIKISKQWCTTHYAPPPCVSIPLNYYFFGRVK